MPTSLRDQARSLTAIELAELLEDHAALTASATAQAVMEEAARAVSPLPLHSVRASPR